MKVRITVETQEGVEEVFAHELPTTTPNFVKVFSAMKYLKRTIMPDYDRRSMTGRLNPRAMPSLPRDEQ